MPSNRLAKSLFASHAQLQLPYQSKSLSNFTSLNKMRTRIDSVDRWFMQEFWFLAPSFKNQSSQGTALKRLWAHTPAFFWKISQKPFSIFWAWFYGVYIREPQNKNLSQEIMSSLWPSLISMWKFPKLKSLIQKPGKILRATLSKWFIHCYSRCSVYPITYLLLQTCKEKRNVLLHSTDHSDFLEAVGIFWKSAITTSLVFTASFKEFS